MKERFRRSVRQRTWSALVLLLAAGVPATGSQADQVALELQLLVEGLVSPVSIVNAGDGSGRLFVVLQGGQIRSYDGTQLRETPFLEISSLITSGGEQGLLDAAFHPQYESNGFFYVNYTDTSGATVIARYSVSPDPDVADPGSALVLLTIPQPFANHNGGQLQFAPDGTLLIALGDGGWGGDPDNRAQNLGDLLGKLLRIDVDAGTPYAIPPDNPFVGVPGAREEIWAYGLRNPWRFSFDRATGDLLIADVGQNDWEEVDFQAASSPGGENYGWRRMEGSACYDPPTECNDGSLLLPILEYSHALGCAITGGYRYRGLQHPHLYGVYLYADFCEGRIWGASESNGEWSTTELLDTPFFISSFGQDESGELFLAHNAQEVNSQIYRIVATPGCADALDNDGDGFVDANDLGCTSAADASERDETGAHPCDDGVSNEAGVQIDTPVGPVALTDDGLVDLEDPGCGGNPFLPAPGPGTGGGEYPQCQDGIENDLDGNVDFDRGVSVFGSPQSAAADAHCAALTDPREQRKNFCGLGFEMVPALLWLGRRRRGRRRPAPAAGTR